MTCLSVASRVASQEVGWQKCSKKLFCIFPKTGSFLEPLANACIERLPMLYCEGSRLNGLWSPFGIETLLPLDSHSHHVGLNGLWSPFGIETPKMRRNAKSTRTRAKWPVEPVRD